MHSGIVLRLIHAQLNLIAGLNHTRSLILRVMNYGVLIAISAYTLFAAAVIYCIYHAIMESKIFRAFLD